jgi:hypothetical protein
MRISGRESWDVWSRVLQIVGGVSLLIADVWFTGLEIYYASNRPYGPFPERGWTVPLRWTHGLTFEENQQLLQLFEWGWWFGLVLWVGMWIRQLQAKKEPWNKDTVLMGTTK